MEPSPSSSSYSHLLDKTRLPFSTFQRLAVVSIFEKLRLDPLSTPARDALARCLSSPSASVLDQSVRELCRLVRSRRLSASLALLELHSALEGRTGPDASINVILKGIGFVCRFAFHDDPSWRKELAESPATRHPFVMALSHGDQVHEEVQRQMLLFIVQNMAGGLDLVFEFLHPLLTFSVLKIASSAEMGLFVKEFMSLIAVAGGSFQSEGVIIVDHLLTYLKFFPLRDEKVIEVR